MSSSILLPALTFCRDRFYFPSPYYVRDDSTLYPSIMSPSILYSRRYILSTSILLPSKHSVTIDSTPVLTFCPVDSTPALTFCRHRFYSGPIFCRHRFYSGPNIMSSSILLRSQHYVVIDSTLVRTYCLHRLYTPPNILSPSILHPSQHYVSIDSTPVPTFCRHRFYSRPSSSPEHVHVR